MSTEFPYSLSFPNGAHWKKTSVGERRQSLVLAQQGEDQEIPKIVRLDLVNNQELGWCVFIWFIDPMRQPYDQFCRQWKIPITNEADVEGSITAGKELGKRRPIVVTYDEAYAGRFSDESFGFFFNNQGLHTFVSADELPANT